MEKKICYIVAGGDCISGTLPNKKEDLLICSDGGFRYFVDHDLEPDLVVGDFDSLRELEPSYQEAFRKLEQRHPEKIKRLPEAKDDTDTLAALRFGLALGYREFQIFGALGGNRFDHSISNLQALLFLKRQGANGWITDEKRNIFLLENEEIVFPDDMDALVSVFAMAGMAQGVTLQGLTYNLENASLDPAYPIGTSNRFVPGQQGRIAVANGVLLVIVEMAV